MKDFISPDPFKFDSAVDFFKEVIQLNSSSADFSQRKLMTSLQWPQSFLSDVLSGRKNMTILRTMEFATFADLDPMQTEKLIYLCIDNQIPSACKGRIFSNRISSEPTPNPEFRHLSRDTYALYIFEIIKWLRGQASMEQILQVAKTIELDSEIVEQSISSLIESAIIRPVESGGFEILVDDIVDDEFCDEEHFKQGHRLYAQSFHNYWDRPEGPSCYNGCFVELPRGEEYSVIVDKILALRNWIFEYAKSVNKRKKSKPTETLLFQLDLNLFPVVEKNIDLDLPQH